MKTLLESRSLEFGVNVIKLLQNNPTLDFTQRSKEQLSSSATSIGANIAEARSGQSRLDFISKMEIALKEARETDYWLSILIKLLPKPTDAQSKLLKECNEITAMLAASVKTAKANGMKKTEMRVPR